MTYTYHGDMVPDISKLTDHEILVDYVKITGRTMLFTPNDMPLTAYLTAKLAGESAEFAMAHLILTKSGGRDAGRCSTRDPETAISELCDVFWYFAHTCAAVNFNYEQVIKAAPAFVGAYQSIDCGWVLMHATGTLAEITFKGYRDGRSAFHYAQDHGEALTNVAYALLRCIREMGLQLETIAGRSARKQDDRIKRGVVSGKGDNR